MVDKNRMIRKRENRKRRKNPTQEKGGDRSSTRKGGGVWGSTQDEKRRGSGAKKEKVPHRKMTKRGAESEAQRKTKKEGNQSSTHTKGGWGAESGARHKTSGGKVRHMPGGANEKIGSSEVTRFTVGKTLQGST